MKQAKKKETDYGVVRRIGKKFYDELEEIKQKRLDKKMEKRKISNSKITNLITEHNLWDDVKEDMINVKLSKEKK